MYIHQAYDERGKLVQVSVYEDDQDDEDNIFIQVKCHTDTPFVIIGTPRQLEAISTAINGFLEN